MRILRADQFSDRLLTDPQYVQKGITEWIKNWKKNGWKNSTGKLVKNIELRKQLDELCCMCNVTWYGFVASMIMQEMNGLTNWLIRELIS